MAKAYLLEITFRLPEMKTGSPASDAADEITKRYGWTWAFGEFVGHDELDRYHRLHGYMSPTKPDTDTAARMLDDLRNAMDLIHFDISEVEDDDDD